MTTTNNTPSIEIGLFGNDEKPGISTQLEEDFYTRVSPDALSATIPTNWAHNKLSGITTIEELATFLRKNIGEITTGVAGKIKITTDTNFLQKLSIGDLEKALSPYELAEQIRVRVWMV